MSTHLRVEFFTVTDDSPVHIDPATRYGYRPEHRQKLMMRSACGLQVPMAASHVKWVNELLLPRLPTCSECAVRYDQLLDWGVDPLDWDSSVIDALRVRLGSPPF